MGMQGVLVLTRRIDEDIIIGPSKEDVVVRVLGIKGGQVKIGVKAPPATEVDRGEIRDRKDVERGKLRQPAPATEDPADLITDAEAQRELRKLIEFFRGEGSQLGNDGDHDGLSPADTAIRAMRKMGVRIASLRAGHDPNV